LTTTLAGTTNYLLRYPETLEKLTREIRDAFKTEAKMNLTNLGKLLYLSAVIEEGLRIISPVPLGMPRVVPKGGDFVCGDWLPEDVSPGCILFLSSKLTAIRKDLCFFHAMGSQSLRE
jgi:hypothetical protein